MRTRRGETSLRTERWVAAPKPRRPHLNSMSANPPHARSRRNRTRITETRQTWPPSHARHPRAPTTRHPAGMHGSKLTTPDAPERGLRLATRAIVRVRTRFDVSARPSAQSRTVPVCAESRVHVAQAHRSADARRRPLRAPAPAPGVSVAEPLLQRSGDRHKRDIASVARVIAIVAKRSSGRGRLPHQRSRQAPSSRQCRGAAG
jgi:hypothetical protein